MRVRRLWLVLLVLLVPTAARAHDHDADLCVGVSDAHESMLVGVRVTFAKTLPKWSSRDDVKNLNLIADFSTNSGSHDDTDVRHTFFMGGLRYTIARDTRQQHLPFVEVLIGGVHTRNGEGDTDPALAIGAGYEYVPNRNTSRWGIRVQGDYVVRPNDITPRISAGILWRFKKS